MATNNPYRGLPPDAFWKKGVVSCDPYIPENLYNKKFEIHPHTQIGCAGSCFAQNIYRSLKADNGYCVPEFETAPQGLDAISAERHGYGLYNARYGNIYTVKQLSQLIKEAFGIFKPSNYIWKKGTKYIDALRPGVEPVGFEEPSDVAISRIHHLSKVREMFESIDIFIFTLGLTECWTDTSSKTVYPMAPGTIAGTFSKDAYSFANETFHEIVSEFNDVMKTLSAFRKKKDIKYILTVSPVPLTATASGKHILQANNHSKSILRAAASHLEEANSNIAYFPSYEIVTNPRLNSKGFNSNLRTIDKEIIKAVMNYFTTSHNITRESKPIPESVVGEKDKLKQRIQPDIEENTYCDEVILEAFS